MEIEIQNIIVYSDLGKRVSLLRIHGRFVRFGKGYFRLVFSYAFKKMLEEMYNVHKMGIDAAPFPMWKLGKNLRSGLGTGKLPCYDTKSE